MFKHIHTGFDHPYTITNDISKKKLLKNPKFLPTFECLTWSAKCFRDRNKETLKNFYRTTIENLIRNTECSLILVRIYIFSGSIIPEMQGIWCLPRCLLYAHQLTLGCQWTENNTRHTKLLVNCTGATREDASVSHTCKGTISRQSGQLTEVILSQISRKFRVSEKSFVKPSLYFKLSR